MKRFILILVAVVGGLCTSTAQMRTAYFMEGSYFRTDMNAALPPTRGYLQIIPVVGGVGVNLGNNYLSVNNFIYKKEDGLYTFLSGKVSSDEFLKKLGNAGKISANLNTTILGFGAHTKRLFWSFGINLRSNTEITLSKDMFSILKSLSNGHYDLGDTHISNREYLEAALGFAIPIKEFMTFGFRVKGLIGVADLSMKTETMGIDVGEDAVRAEFLGHIRGNCPLFAPNYTVGAPFSTDGILQTDYMQALKNLKSWGLGLDLGFEFRLLDDHLKVSVGVNDLGFIRWNGVSTVNADGKASFSYEGFDLTSSEPKIDGGFEATMAKPSGTYLSRLSCSLNAGVEYNILNNHIAFGLLSHSEFCQNFNRTELTASVNFRIGRWLSTSFSHTFLNGNQPGVLGWALNIHPTGFHLFLGADFIDTRFAVYRNIPIPKMMSSANVYVGVGFNLGKAKYMKSMQKRVKKSKGGQELPQPVEPTAPVTPATPAAPAGAPATSVAAATVTATL